MIKLKDILLEHPSDYTDKKIGKIGLLRRKKKYEPLDGAQKSEAVNPNKLVKIFDKLEHIKY